VLIVAPEVLKNSSCSIIESARSYGDVTFYFFEKKPATRRRVVASIVASAHHGLTQQLGFGQSGADRSSGSNRSRRGMPDGPL
jgi:hypothetical protein